MTWLKVSDTAAQHPVVQQPLLEEPPERFDAYDMVNAAFGLVTRCATHAAGFGTDYRVADATVAAMAGPNWRDRAERAARAGYWHRAEGGGWVILDDPENFLHIRLKAEVDWERQRRRDTSDAALVCPVRLRDGDSCRYCSMIVNWRDRKSGRGGTYDHRIPGKPAQSPDDLRVACNSCNGARSSSPDADTRRPLRPAPTTPFYGAETVAMLAKHGIHVPPSTTRPATTDTAPTRDLAPSDDTATATPATRQPAGHRPTTRPATADTAPAPTATQPTAGHRTPRPGAQPATATPRDLAQRLTPRQQDQHADLTDPADRRHAGSGSPGRDGTGRVPTYPNPARTAGRRRGRRGRTLPPDTKDH